MSKPTGKYMAAIQLGLVAFAFLAAGCSKSSEAKSRQDQEKEFHASFGFLPPASVTNINHSSRYERYALDAGYGQWMRFTFHDDVFSRILKDKGFKKGLAASSNSESKAQPSWWQNVDSNSTDVHTREGNDGYSYREIIWHDPKSGFVYWHQDCWD